jgi:hypothetical protein
MSTETEHWLPAVGWEGLYEVSDMGRVRSLPRQTTRGVLGGQERKPVVDGWGRPKVNLSIQGHSRCRYISALVAEAFIGPRPPGSHCCHGDGNPANNHLPNLRWDTPARNEADKRLHGTALLGERHHSAKLTETQVRAIRSDSRPQEIIAAEYGIKQPHVSDIKRRLKWAHVP